jgi:hypothetical protein
MHKAFQSEMLINTRKNLVEKKNPFLTFTHTGTENGFPSLLLLLQKKNRWAIKSPL